MKPTLSYKVETVKYGRNSISAIIFWVDASSKVEAIRLANSMIQPGYEIERVYRPKAFHLEMS